jgi:hypothetical protein
MMKLFKGRKKKDCFEKFYKIDAIGHIIRHNEFIVNILEGAIYRKKAMARP